MKRLVLSVITVVMLAIYPVYGQSQARQRQQSQSASAISPEAVAKQMVATIDDVTFKAVNTLTRSNTVGKDYLRASSDKFRPLYQKATGENLDDPQVGLPFVGTFMRIIGKPRFHKNGTFHPEVADQYLARIGQIDNAILLEWQGALEKIAGKSIQKGQVAFAIMEVDSLFDGATIKPDGSKKLLSRLASIGGGPIAKWRQTLGESNIDNVYASISLLDVEGLFSADRFQEELFTKALPAASRLIQEGRGAK